MTVTIRRPNGKAYRPRKSPTVETYFDVHDDSECVVVFRTHDIPQAIQLAADRIEDLELDSELAYTDWWRQVPWSAGSYDWQWISDSVRGVPCVVIPHE
jgi:hypothetical protein